MLAMKLLAVALAAALALPGAHAGLNGHQITAEWHAASTPYKNYFNPELKLAPFYDPAWANTKHNSAKNLIVGPDVEFGWGMGPGQMITLDAHDDGRVVLTAHCDAQHAECDFEDTHMTVQSSAFLGASLILKGTSLSGKLAFASLHAQEGQLEVKIKNLKITPNGQTKTETCSFEIMQPNFCVSGDCCDMSTGEPRTAGSICRPAKHPCDIIEMCDGFSSKCPPDRMTTDEAHCQQADVQHDSSADNKPKAVVDSKPTPSAQEQIAFNDKRAPGAKTPEVGPPAEPNHDDPLPHHDDVHGDLSEDCVRCPRGAKSGPHCCQEAAGSWLNLQYLGLAALAAIVMGIVLRDRLGNQAKIVSPGGLPAHHRGHTRW